MHISSSDLPRADASQQEIFVAVLSQQPFKPEALAAQNMPVARAPSVKIETSPGQFKDFSNQDLNFPLSKLEVSSADSSSTISLSSPHQSWKTAAANEFDANTFVFTPDVQTRIAVGRDRENGKDFFRIAFFPQSEAAYFNAANEYRNVADAERDLNVGNGELKIRATGSDNTQHTLISEGLPVKVTTHGQTSLGLAKTEEDGSVRGNATTPAAHPMRGFMLNSIYNSSDKSAPHFW